MKYDETKSQFKPLPMLLAPLIVTDSWRLKTSIY